MTSPAEAAYRLAARSQRLQRRRLELLPLTGPDAVFTDVQGRGWGSGATTAPAELEDLISSIATSGLLQPVLVEQLPGGARRVVSGHRRLLAMRWGAVHLPHNPHFQLLAANVVDGPLTEEEKRTWQLIENLARSDLQPGELAAALLYERCAVLATKLDDEGIPVPDHITSLDDPIARFSQLDRLRRDAGLHDLGAPWEEVLNRLGLQLSAAKAKKLVQAFRALPATLSSEMDEAAVSLASRQHFIRLHRGHRQAAEEIWAAVRARDQPQLLTRAVTQAHHQTNTPAADLVEAAATYHDTANTARAHTLASKGGGEPSPPSVPAEVVAAVRESHRRLLNHLRAGHALDHYDRGSLCLVMEELTRWLNAAPLSPTP